MKIDDNTLERLDTLLGLCKISHKKESAIQHLSQGEKQRVAISRALITQPKILLCDEATGNLDPETGGLVLDHIISVSKHFNTTLLFITHNMSAKEKFNRIINIESLS